MKPAIVIDTSREIPYDLYDVHNIYPIVYYVLNSDNEKINERIDIQLLQTPKLISTLKRDRKSKIFAPSIKDFVELYTYLSEEFDTLISIHSSLHTPAVFENALIAKKMVSEISIDIIDSPTLGSSAGLFVEELGKIISGAKNINEIRKEAINLNKYIHSYVLSRNVNLTSEGESKIKSQTSLKKFLNPYVIHHFFHGEWDETKKGRSSNVLFKDMKNGLEIVYKAKELKSIYYSSTSEFEKEIEDILGSFTIPNVRKTPVSLIKHLLLGKNYCEIAFI
jgi:fatty acid-binding protein DegV